MLAFRDVHQVGGDANEIYVSTSTATENARYTVVRVASPLRDPDDRKLARLRGDLHRDRAGAPRRRPGQDGAHRRGARNRAPAPAAGRDNTETPSDLQPAPAEHDTHGRILDVVGGTDLVGLYQVVVINRGRSQGSTPAPCWRSTTAATWCRMSTAAAASGRKAAARSRRRCGCRDERNGTLLVFKSFDRASYALIVGASDTIHVQDVVHNP